MPPMILSLLTNKGVWVGIVVAIILSFVAIQSLHLKHAHAQIEDLNVQLKDARAATDVAINANGTNLEVINALQDQIQTMIEQRAFDAEQRKTEIVKRDALLVAARKETDTLRRKINAGFQSSASCTSLQTLRVDTACSDVADRLRERTASHHSN